MAARWFHWLVTQEPVSPPAVPPDAVPPGAVPPYPAPPPGYVWVYPPQPRDGRWRPPYWLKIISAIWVVVLIAGASWYALHGKPSVREQTTIGEAQPVVNRAVVDVVNAAGGGPVVAVSAFERVSSCKITPVRSGADYRRVVDLYTSPGTESAILHMIASGLPARYHADATSAGKLTLYADAGDYVAVNGTVPAPGLVEVAAVTGCRQETGAAVTKPSPALGSSEGAALGPVLGALGLPAAPAATVAKLVCPSGGALRSVQAMLPRGSAPASLAITLRPLSATPAVATPTRYAYRSGAVDVVARSNAAARTVTVTATSRCPT